MVVNHAFSCRTDANKKRTHSWHFPWRNFNPRCTLCASFHLSLAWQTDLPQTTLWFPHYKRYLTEWLERKRTGVSGWNGGCILKERVQIHPHNNTLMQESSLRIGFFSLFLIYMEPTWQKRSCQTQCQTTLQSSQQFMEASMAGGMMLGHSPQMKFWLLPCSELIGKSYQLSCPPTPLLFLCWKLGVWRTTYSSRGISCQSPLLSPLAYSD